MRGDRRADGSQRQRRPQVIGLTLAGSSQAALQTLLVTPCTLLTLLGSRCLAHAAAAADADADAGLRLLTLFPRSILSSSLLCSNVSN